MDAASEPSPRIAAAAAIVVVLGALHLAAAVVGPLLIAVVIAIAFAPIATRVAARGWPAAVTSLVTLAVVVGVLALAGFVAVTVVGDLIASAPGYRDDLQRVADDVAGWLRAHRMPEIARSIAAIDVEGWVGGVLADSVWILGGVLQTLGLVLLLTVFIQLESPTFPGRLRRVLGEASRGDQAERTLRALADVQRYLFVKICAGACKALLVGGLTWAVGLDYAVLWAGLAFVLNVVPVLGAATATVLPVAAASVSLGPEAALGLAVGLLVINVAIGLVAEPRVLGRAVGLSPLVVVLSLALWGFVLGPIGALLAVPLTMVCKLVLEQHPELDWAARLLEHRDTPAVA